MALAVAGGGFGCSRQNTEAPAGESASRLLVSADIRVQTVKGVGVTAAVLAASAGISFGPGSQVISGPAISSLGKVVTQPRAVLSDVFAAQGADLANQVRVNGSVYAPTITRGKDVVITGNVDQSAVLLPPSELKWHVDFPTVNGPSVNVDPHASRDLAPGRFGSVSVAPNSALKLKSGTYYFDSLTLQPNAVLELDQDSGPVLMYVSGSVDIKGTFAALQNGTQPDFALICLGPEAVSVSTPFHGTLVAPNASLSIGPAKATVEGFFSAKSIAVAPNTTVRVVPPLPLLVATNDQDLQACSRSIPVRTDLEGKAREVAFQQDIARYCTMRGGTRCQLDVTSRVNVDYTAAALMLIGQRKTPAEYLAIVRDRTRKRYAAEDDSALAQLLCSGPDADDDLVPDARDKCPNTPSLTPTDDAGCTDSTLPEAPSAADVKKVLDVTPIVWAPQCSGAAPMPKLPAGGFYYPNDKPQGTFILSGRVTNQPAGCPVFYYFDVETLDGSGAPIDRYLTAFNGNEEVTALLGTSTAVPAGYIQFNAKPTESGARGKLGNAGGTNIRYRVMAMNGMGSFAGWSDWKFTTNDDCAALGFKCGG